MAPFIGDETAPFFGFLGAAATLVFSCMGVACGTTKSGVGAASMGVIRVVPTNLEGRLCK
ncbi:V-type proton ATPase 16 kDa proteolipid subunit c1 [Medicago truncatula]|uniref:V-type proton ATPase 16 kDa proteolipid subunit c1 n=1 Tax=Medicago truncatula TaxID=3880 RepID=G7IIT6_MEDTR|nr:V-type proton ATPase 16 kDa proteolipid subunit c1 [Medicago truncatula]